MVGALGERYRALSPDIRGHGASAGIRPVTLEAVVGDVADVVTELVEAFHRNQVLGRVRRAS